MRYTASAKLFAAGTALFAFSSPALALDGNDLVKKLNAALNAQNGMGIVAGSITVDGSDVTLADSRFEMGNGQESLPLGTIELEGVEEDAGAYTVETMSFDNIDFAKDGIAITAQDLSVSGMRIPADPNGDTLDALMFYEEATAGAMEVKFDGKTAASIGSSKMTSELSDDKKSMKFDVRVADIKADLSTIEEPQARQTVADLGISDISGNISMVGSWDVVPGTLAIEEYAFDFGNIGRLNMAFSLSGYTLDFLRSLNEAAKKAEANANDEQAQQAAGLAMLGLIQQLSFNSAEIRFDDDGITTKALDVTAKKQGTTGDQLAQMIKAMAPMMLAQYNMPELQKSLTDALNAYLDDPGSFTISAKPEKSVAVPTIMGAAMAAPNTIPQILGVNVTAND
ncbi:hypothetical protein GAO09_20555 [Rhizobiales bacterium RZME27]|uniref:DUF945 domain-containing protein n=1 Tax=Endobacterium cereale TaxID=2663029 RepID=A0A6A8AEU8_9HYPH|nr:hypothetical protein [Endobacterium cereale]MEB2844016.1 hypothetical protein [Endobacterium cereale]MQY48428.1 hypothetical protein [Endobacterium cereale]